MIYVTMATNYQAKVRLCVIKSTLHYSIKIWHTSLRFSLKYFLSFKLQHIRPVWTECLTLWIKGLHCTHCTVHHAALLLATGWHLFTTCPPFRGIYPFLPIQNINQFLLIFLKVPRMCIRARNTKQIELTICTGTWHVIITSCTKNQQDWFWFGTCRGLSRFTTMDSL